MFGRVLIVAGSPGMSGAAVLCGSGALRGGAGLVFVAVPESIQPIVAGANPCYLTVGLPEQPAGVGVGSLSVNALLEEQLHKATVAVVGPGLGKPFYAQDLLRQLVTASIPVVLDADALNNLGPKPDLLRDHATPPVITPHPGEFARLLGSTVAEVEADREGLAVQFARDYGVIVVLKGASTVVTDGQHLYINTTGNPGMATGGTGDVLSGLLGALLGQGLAPFEGAVLATYLHGLAGDIARDEFGEVSLIASDLLTELPKAFRKLAREHSWV